MKKHETQLQQVKNHLNKHKKISTWIAFEEYYITRLSHYILLMRKEGFKIESKWISPEYGNRYVRYILHKK